jgi:lipopolysaccharide transport system ATP-binding protein
MSDIVIKVEGLGKRYRIGARHQGYKTLREKVNDLALLPFRTARSLASRNGDARRLKSGLGNNPQSAISDSQSSMLWALRDVSFEVKRGEVVGIIGRNGAGKSTLLKVLSRITEPTTGAVDIYGSVGSLIEVGTGFHPELTGRENIFLNGAILGMRKAEIERKFDEIVAFAEVEKFLDTPVKHFSSGMYIRLAFAVAAHLDPDIMVVDEVLAVGDITFQKKCLNLMQDVGKHGRTVLFVSHNMQAVTRLCQRAIILSDGQILSDGPAPQVTSQYLASELGTISKRVWHDSWKAPGNEVVRLRSVRVCGGDGRTAETTDIRARVGIEVEYEVLQSGQVLIPNYHVHNEEGICVFVIQDLNPEWRHRPRPTGRFISTAWIPPNFLAEGTLVVTAAISSYYPMTVHVYERDAVGFQVIDSLEGDSARGDYAGVMPGIVRPIFEWTTQQIA